MVDAIEVGCGAGGEAVADGCGGPAGNRGTCAAGLEGGYGVPARLASGR
jgi:hypothetical protein